MDKSLSLGNQQSSLNLGAMSPEHFILILLHRRWLVLLTFVVVSAGVAFHTRRLPAIFYSETLVLVNPQQVPQRFVEPTVTTNVRSRLTTLSQQILSATRLQTIMDRFNLYAEQRAAFPHEVVIDLMRKDISISMVSDMQAFKIGYSGQDPRVVAQVANELASLFIEENLKERERAATGTTEFIQSELAQTRQELENQEARIRDFKLEHLGEMPEHQVANLQILGQLQAQLRSVNDALERAEQQKNYWQTLLISQNAGRTEKAFEPAQKPLGPNPQEIQLAALLARYGEQHPDVRRFKRVVEEERRTRERARPQDAQVIASAGSEESAATTANPLSVATRAQIDAVEKEIALRKKEEQSLKERISIYQTKVETVPVREQEITGLVRDYDIARDYYSQLLAKKLVAETGTELELRQKGEQFTILDPAQVPERPSRPNRLARYGAGGFAGLALGLLLALATELLGTTVTSPGQIATATGGAVLGVIPILRTKTDRRRSRLAVAGAAVVTAALVLVGAFLLYDLQGGIF